VRRKKREQWKKIENSWKVIVHRMEIVWTFIGNRMDFAYP
jgi:hypothetical protein